MNFTKSLVIISILHGCYFVTDLKASYYLDTLFPIGLTGINPTGSSTPYGSQGWKWAWTSADTLAEDSLIFELGVNCLGCQDAKPDYLINMCPQDTPSTWNDNYLNKVCKPLTDEGHPVYLITAGYYFTPRYWLPAHGNWLYGWNGDTAWHPFEDTFRVLASNEAFFLDSTPVDLIEYRISNNAAVVCTVKAYNDQGGVIGIWKNQTPSKLFRSPTRGSILVSDQAGVGSMQLSGHTDGKEYNRHGRNKSAGDNWNTFVGDSVWCEVVDEAINNFYDFFDTHPEKAQYIWGFNFLTEDPSLFRFSNGNSDQTHWRGCWAACDRLLSGSNSHFSINYNSPEHKQGRTQPPINEGLRGKENDLLSEAFGNQHRMFIAKFNPWASHKMGYNIFEALPELDAIVAFWHGWCRAQYNYGEQGLFDHFLYGTGFDKTEDKYVDKLGYHHTAVYMQMYGNTNLARSDQKRRWIPWIALEWIAWGSGPNVCDSAKLRRPCPPEIRCAAYLLMSRGAKGILFHGWTFGTKYDYDNNNKNITVPIPAVKIPNTYGLDDYWGDTYNVGIRGQDGYPFGRGPDAANHKLNDGPDIESHRTYWHNYNKDSTYDYLCTLIPELKLITSTLMQLDWVNGYSLNSTDPNWSSPCPHEYVMDVSGVSYMDLGLFDHPYEPVGVEYFMLVNREGIADMTNRTVTVALDAGHWPGADSLTLTDIANKEHPQTLKRDGNRYVFTQVFEPGEGKLYRVSQINQAPIALSK